MRRGFLVALLVLVMLIFGSGCAYKYTFKTSRSGDPARIVREWRHIALWGWTGTAPFDLRVACPDGYAEFGSYVSFTNWLCAFTTLGIYAPRTVYAVPVVDVESVGARELDR